MAGSALPKIFGASVKGSLHDVLKTPCQDAHAFKKLSSGEVVIAVADGLGSAAKSEIGSQLAVDTVVAYYDAAAQASPSSEFKLLAKEALLGAIKALEAKARELNCKTRDLACTIILVVADKRATVRTAHIGDGAVVARKKDALVVVSDPGDSEYANEVTPLTSDKWESALRIDGPIDGVREVAVFTDGLQRAAFSIGNKEGKPTAHDRFWFPLLNFAQKLQDLSEGKKELEELLGSPRICDNSDDDKTLVIAVLEGWKEGLPPVPKAADPPAAPAAAKPAPISVALPSPAPAAISRPSAGGGRMEPARSPAPVAPSRPRGDDTIKEYVEMIEPWFVPVTCVFAILVSWVTWFVLLPHFLPKYFGDGPPSKSSQGASRTADRGSNGRSVDENRDSSGEKGKDGGEGLATNNRPNPDSTNLAHGGSDRPRTVSEEAQDIFKSDFPETFLKDISMKRLVARGIELQKKGRLISAYAAYGLAMDKDTGKDDQSGKGYDALKGKLDKDQKIKSVEIRKLLQAAFDEKNKALDDSKKAEKEKLWREIQWVEIPKGTLKPAIISLMPAAPKPFDKSPDSLKRGGATPDFTNPAKTSIPAKEISAFQMAKTEVTVQEYQDCVLQGACSKIISTCVLNPNEPSHPIACVTWEQARVYCESKKARLPSEDEWEYAARSAGTGWEFPWGNGEPTCDRAVMGNGKPGCGNAATGPVCSKPKGNSKQHLCDMVGNVWEWTQDRYIPPDPLYYLTHPVTYVARGGSFRDKADDLRPARRSPLDSGQAFPNVGFRCAKDGGEGGKNGKSGE